MIAIKISNQTGDRTKDDTDNHKEEDHNGARGHDCSNADAHKRRERREQQLHHQQGHHHTRSSRAPRNPSFSLLGQEFHEAAGNDSKDRNDRGDEGTHDDQDDREGFEVGS